MGVQLHLIRTIKSIGVISVIAAYSAVASAQTLGVLNNQVSISVPGTSFNTTTTISNTGTVAAVTGVPTTGTLTTPVFSFTLQQTGVASTSGTYAVGIILQEASSQRRLEVYIPGVVFNFDGSSNLSGLLNNPTVNIYGRDSTGTVAAFTSVASGGSVSFNGNTLSFSAADQIALIQSGPASILNDITTSINNTGLSYTYTVILKNTAGTAYSFQHNVLGTPTAFPAATANEFLVGGAQNDADEGILSGGQKLTGTLTFAASGGGGGGGSTPQAAAEQTVSATTSSTTGLLNSISSGGVTPATLTALATLVSESTTAVNSVITGLANGTVTPSTGITLATALASQITAIKQIVDAGADVSSTQLTATVNNMKNVIAALTGKTLTPSEQVQLRVQMTNGIADTTTLMASLRNRFGFLSADPLVSIDAFTVDTVVADITAIVDGLEGMVNSSLEIPGITLTSAVFNSVQSASQTAAELLFTPIGAQLGLNIAYNTDASAQALLAQNTTLLDRLLDSVAINLGNSTQITAATAQTALTGAGLSSALATSLSNDLTAFVKPDGLTVDTGSGSSSASGRLQTALNATSLSVDQTTGVVSYTIANENRTAHLLAVLSAPTIFPTADLTLPDGSRFIVHNELAFILAPAISDVTGFAAAINTVGAGKFTTAIRGNGTIVLSETASNVKFVSAISNSANTSTSSSGSTTFTAPSGDPAAATYLFTVQHANGTRQTIVPVIADDAFINSVGNYGFTVTTDKATGTVLLGSFRFRPDYFQTPLTSADALFLDSTKDSSGVAYRPINANGDGIGDYQVVTASGVQIFYGLP